MATNSEKAGFVRSLALEDYRTLGDHQQAISYLLNALVVNMHSLSDFRLRIPWRYGDQPWFRSLEKILWSVYDSEFGNFDLLETNYWRHSNVHFRLQTLYCDKDLNLSRIMSFLES